jgi:hypothetical protein
MQISPDFITNSLESGGTLMMVVVVNRFTKIAHFILIKKKILQQLGSHIKKM